MVGMGGYLTFDNPSAIPLWFVWLASLFLWYVGVAVYIGGVGWALFCGSVRQAQEGAPVARVSQASSGSARTAVARFEVPEAAD